jgi:hypothetical protein
MNELQAWLVVGPIFVLTMGWVASMILDELKEKY